MKMATFLVVFVMAATAAFAQQAGEGRSPTDRTATAAVGEPVLWLECSDPRVVAAMGTRCSTAYEQMRVTRLNAEMCRPYFWTADCRPWYGDNPPFQAVAGIEYVGVYGFAMTIEGQVLDKFGDLIFICRMTRSGGDPPVGTYFGWPQMRGGSSWCIGSLGAPGCN